MPCVDTIAAVSVIGVDFGRKRIGIASSESWKLATPHSIIRHPGADDVAMERVARLGRELQAELFVLGMPRGNRHDGERIQARFEHLASLLRATSQCDVVLWDETLSTVDALEKRRARGRRGDEDIDHEAAALILQSWLDHRRSS